MNIAFDAVAILGNMSRNRGIGNYALSQFTGMIERDKNNHYFFLNLIDGDFSLADLVENKSNLTEDFIYTGENNSLISEKYSDVIGNIIKRYIRENNIDIFYITSPFDSIMKYRKEWFYGVKVVSTVYDIIPYVMQDRYLKDRNVREDYMKCIENLRWSDELFVISGSVKTDLIKYLNFSPEKIKIIWGAVDDRYKIIDIPECEKILLLEKFGITKPFIMCTGGEDSRKNIDGLIRAYALMPENIRKKYQLAVVCKLSENSINGFKTVARARHIEDDIIFTNFVTDDELLKLYNLAVLMAFPSKYEGFGLPIVEAWACGTPVLTANNSSLVEIGGEAVILVNAYDDRSIADGMAKILSDEKILDDYAQRGMKRLDLYRWDKINDNIISLLDNISVCEKINGDIRKKIAVFTPLPPLQSGIADYSQDIINELSQYFDIDIFIEENYNPVLVFPQNVNIYSYRAYPKRINQYHDTIFQVGNSEYHVYMYPYIKQYHGTMVLHDLNLHGAFCHYSMTVNKGNYAMYKTFIDSDIDTPDMYINSLKSGTANPDIYNIVLNSYLADSADRIIVHSEYAKKNLLMKNIARNVEVIPLYAKIEPLKNTSEAKRKNGFDDNKIIISALGGIHETKRIIPIVKAFARLAKNNDNVHLVLVGKFHDDMKKKLDEIINSENISEKITLTGYTDMEKFNEYIDMTDICLNLRYPYNGETSGSLMRILAKGKCSVVNDIGSFSEIPDGACIKIPSADKTGETEEVNQIYSTLKKLSENSDIRIKTGNSARSFAENVLDIKSVGIQYRNFINSEKTISPVTEKLIETVRNDLNITPRDFEKIAQTLSYAKK
ncbi:MAG: glycosyltransferase [Ruminococcus sp.]|nr:glycosyltransferase [Ruminococcus sp.]